MSCFCGAQREEEVREAARSTHTAGDTPARHHCTQEVHQFTGVLLLAVVEVHAIAALTDAQSTDVGAVLQQQLLQVEERLLVTDLGKATAHGTCSSEYSCKTTDRF